MVLNGYDWFAVHVATGRQLLENVADQMRRQDPEYWGKYWLEKAKRALVETNTLIVPDCRHEEEAKKIITLCEMAGIKYQFYFCDYKSDRYEIRDHSSEKFAQKILAMGATDGLQINSYIQNILFNGNSNK